MFNDLALGREFLKWLEDVIAGAFGDVCEHLRKNQSYFLTKIFRLPCETVTLLPIWPERVGIFGGNRVGNRGNLGVPVSHPLIPPSLKIMIVIAIKRFGDDATQLAGPQGFEGIKLGASFAVPKCPFCGAVLV